MDTVINKWLENELLVPNPNLKYAQPMFFVPKPDNQVRPTIDYSEWTQFIIAPRFSLLTAGSTIRKIPLGNLLIKLDLKSGSTSYHLPNHLTTTMEFAIEVLNMH